MGGALLFKGERAAYDRIVRGQSFEAQLVFWALGIVALVAYWLVRWMYSAAKRALLPPAAQPPGEDDGQSVKVANWWYAAKLLGCAHGDVQTGPAQARRSVTAIHGEVEASRVFVHCRAPWNRGLESAHTYVRAVTKVAPASFRLELAPQGAAAALAAKLGSEDLLLGDPGFDAAFIVRTSSAALARRVLRGPLLEALRATLGASYRVEGRTVTATCPGAFDEPEALVAFVRAVVTLAGAPASDLQHWTELATTIGAAVAAPADTWTEAGALPPFEVTSGGVPLRIEAIDDDTRRVRVIAEHQELDVVAEPAELEEAMTTLSGGAALPYRG